MPHFKDVKCAFVAATQVICRRPISRREDAQWVIAQFEKLVPVGRVHGLLHLLAKALGMASVYSESEPWGWLPCHVLYTVEPRAFTHPDSEAEALANGFFVGAALDYALLAIARAQVLSGIVLTLHPDDTTTTAMDQYQTAHPELLAYGLQTRARGLWDQTLELIGYEVKPRHRAYISGSSVLHAMLSYVSEHDWLSAVGISPDGEVASQYRFTYKVCQQRIRELKVGRDPASGSACNRSWNPNDVDVFLTDRDDMMAIANARQQPDANRKDWPLVAEGPSILRIDHVQFVLTSQAYPAFDFPICCGFVNVHQEDEDTAGQILLSALSTYCILNGIVTSESTRGMGTTTQRIQKYLDRGFRLPREWKDHNRNAPAAVVWSPKSEPLQQPRKFEMYAIDGPEAVERFERSLTPISARRYLHADPERNDTFCPSPECRHAQPNNPTEPPESPMVVTLTAYGPVYDGCRGPGMEAYDHANRMDAPEGTPKFITMYQKAPLCETQVTSTSSEPAMLLPEMPSRKRERTPDLCIVSSPTEVFTDAQLQMLEDYEQRRLSQPKPQ